MRSGPGRASLLAFLADNDQGPIVPKGDAERRYAIADP